MIYMEFASLFVRSFVRSIIKLHQSDMGPSVVDNGGGGGGVWSVGRSVGRSIKIDSSRHFFVLQQNGPWGYPR